MSKVTLDNVTLEVIGTSVYLTLPSNYILTVNKSPQYPTTNIPFYPSQRDSVEASGNTFYNK